MLKSQDNRNNTEKIASGNFATELNLKHPYWGKKITWPLTINRPWKKKMKLRKVKVKFKRCPSGLHLYTMHGQKKKKKRPIGHEQIELTPYQRAAYNDKPLHHCFSSVSTNRLDLIVNGNVIVAFEFLSKYLRTHR